MRRSTCLLGLGNRYQYGRILSNTLTGQPIRSKSFIAKSLKEPLVTGNNAAKVLGDRQKTASSESKVSKLSNGITVASLDNVGGSCTLGVLVNSGSKNESNHPSGVSHFLEKLAFNSTNVFPIREVMDRCGGVFDCQTDKDITIYTMSGKSEELESLVRVLGEVVLRPRLTDEEVEVARRQAEYEIQVMGMLPPPDNILSEMIHRAAFSHNTYGLPKFCPADNLGRISRADLLAFLAAHYRPEEMVVSAVGVPHEPLLRHVEAHFGAWPAWAEAAPPAERPSVGQYTGGQATERRDLAAYHQPMPEFAHVVLGLEACANTDPLYVPAAVLNAMMGGGGSFSAGGPGNGMFSRLYVKVLEQYHWVNSAVAQLQCYTETGLFTISTSAEPRFISDLVQVISSEMRAMAGPISESELARAKRQLQSFLLMSLELRSLAMEDQGRQILAYGERRSPEWWFDQIERVREDDVRDVAQRMLQSKPSLIGFGRVDNLPSYDYVVRQLTTKEKFMPFDPAYVQRLQVSRLFLPSRGSDER